MAQAAVAVPWSVSDTLSESSLWIGVAVSRSRFTRLLPHYRRLIRDGISTDAVIVKSQPRRLNASAAHIVYRITLEVRFDDGTVAHVVRTVTPLEVGVRYNVGDILPVRYDPADHTDIDVDVPAFKARQQQARDEADQRRLEALPDRAAAQLLERLVRLKVEHEAGTVSETQLRAAAQVPGSGSDVERVARIASAIVGDPVPGTPEERVAAEDGARLLERTVRLKLRHESGELDEQQYQARRAELAEAAGRLDTEG